MITVWIGSKLQTSKTRINMYIQDRDNIINTVGGASLVALETSSNVALETSSNVALETPREGAYNSSL